MSHIESWGKTWNHESFVYLDWTMKRWAREFSIGKAVLDSTQAPDTYQLRLNGVPIGVDFEARNPYQLWSTVGRLIGNMLRLQRSRITDEIEELEKR